MEFIRVLGPDPKYNGRVCFQHIPIHIIVKVYPIFGVPGQDGSHWLCTYDHPNARVVTHGVITADGTEYSCGHRNELEKIGIVEPEPKPPVGFLTNDKKERQTVELMENSDKLPNQQSESIRC